MKRFIFLLLALLVAGSASATTKVQVMTDGVIDVDRLPTISFFQETDPSSPELGQIWWNNATNQLKVAGALGVYEFNATSLVEWDTTPAAFSFTDVASATTSTVYTSDPITVAGINHPAAISVSGDASAKYSVNSGTATAVNGTVASGDSVRAVVTSSASDGTAVNATVTIGGVSDAFGVTTASGVSYLVDEDFEGAGAPSGWTTLTEGNTAVDWDSTSSPISGLQSMELSADSPGRYIVASYDSETEFNTVQFNFRVSTAILTSSLAASIRDTSNNLAVSVSVNESGNITLTFGGSTVSSTQTITTGQDYLVKIEYTKGSGDACAAIYVYQDGDFVKFAEVTGKSVTYVTKRVRIGLGMSSAAGDSVVIDDVKAWAR